MPAPIAPRTRREDRAPPNWDRSLDPLAPSAVPDMMRPGYLRRFEAFLREVRPESLSLLCEGELTGDLQQVLSRFQWVGLEFRHSVDALQLRLVDVAEVSAGKATLRFAAAHRNLRAVGSQLRVKRRRASVGWRGQPGRLSQAPDEAPAHRRPREGPDHQGLETAASMRLAIH